ncbi:MAG: NADPH:quinone oxidoreductase family protein [Acidimicrobiia bacterium]|nr:NADPH:quinone oxidoreductase family protein [Acidimicrobiia bacterium]
MRAAICREYGGPEMVGVEEVAASELGPGQVRVAVHAAAINFPDVLLVANEYQIHLPLPFVPGSEFAGIVTEIAPDVVAPAVGARVVGSGLHGAFAEEVVVGAGAVQPVPDGIDFHHAAAFGIAHRTAFHTLRSVARIQPGEELVVLGAGGGVGLAAVQLGAVLGATVTAVASSPEKLDAAAAHGARRLVNHRAGPLRAALREVLPDGADVVIDPVGGNLAEPALRSLGWGGRFVTVGYAAGDIPRIPLNLVLLKGITVLGFEFGGFLTHHTDEFLRNEHELTELWADGRVRPHIGATFPLDDVADALALVGAGRAIGKVDVEVISD